MDELVGTHTRELMPALAAFEVVATTGHVTRGAELLDVPQSSVSRRLRALEKALGVTLFVPSGRRLVLTATGRDLLTRIRGPLRAVDRALAATVDDADANVGLVRLGFPMSLGTNRIPRLLADFHDVAPGVRLALRQAHGAELVRGLREGELDLAIVIPAPLDVPATVLGAQRLWLHLPRDHRLAQRKRVRLGDFAADDVIANPPTYHLRQETERWCAAAGFVPRVTVEVADFATLRSMVGQGLGVAIMPLDPDRAASTDYVVAELVGAKSDTKFERSIGLARTPAGLSPAASRLHDFIADQLVSVD